MKIGDYVDWNTKSRGDSKYGNDLVTIRHSGMIVNIDRANDVLIVIEDTYGDGCRVLKMSYKDFVE